MIYLDNSATTRPYDEVLETYLTVAKNYFGNPSSMHQLGMESENVLSRAREVVASLLKVQTKEILFTSGGTEGNNLAIKGIALEHKKRGNHLITSSIEHSSSTEAFKQLEKMGYDVSYLPVDKDGRVSVEELKKEIRSDTILVSLIHVNNETGVIQPIYDIGKLLEKFPKIFFHVDAVQSITKVPLDLQQMRIDLCTISAHKFHGLKGTGVLYIRSGVTLSPLFHGGTQELQMRAGTENVAGIAALVKALRLSLENGERNSGKLQKLKGKLYDALTDINGIQINSNKELSAPHIINFSIENVKPEVVIQSLSKKNIYVSTKSACSSKLAEPSHVLLAMGLSEKRAESAIRISMSFDNQEEDIEQLIYYLQKIVPELLDVVR